MNQVDTQDLVDIMTDKKGKVAHDGRRRGHLVKLSAFSISIVTQIEEALVCKIVPGKHPSPLAAMRTSKHKHRYSLHSNRLGKSRCEEALGAGKS